MGKLLTMKGAIILRKDASNLIVAKTKGNTGLKENETILCPETVCDSEKPIYRLQDFRPEWISLFDKTGLQTFFTIKTTSGHLGYLCIGAKVGNVPYKDSELGFIENLVIISAAAISNSRLIAELKETNRQLDQKVQELNTLFDISKEFNAMVDRTQIMNVFRFALMGQMFVRKFFFLMQMDGKPSMVIQQGLTGEMAIDEMHQLFDIKTDFIQVTELQHSSDFLKSNSIHSLIRLKFQNETAILGIGKRVNNQPFKKSDYDFLASLGSLVFLTIQKTFLMESRIEKEKLEEELNLARTIQNALLPNPVPTPSGYDIAAVNVPSRHVGGDYYDVIQPFPAELYLAIADVTGKGIPASLLMANLQAMLHVLAPLKLDLSVTTGKINDIIYKNTPSDKFISFFWGKLDLSTNLFHYSNAGHNPPIHVDGVTGEISLLSTGGMLLGALPSMIPYEVGIKELKEGDVVLMFTDGVSESMDEKDEEYGEEKIAECVQKNHKKTASQIMDELLNDVRLFCNNNYGDDLTVLIIKKI
jgi:sigma-B regulation protein RsbU (phosphoserine phosphatase)